MGGRLIRIFLIPPFQKYFLSIYVVIDLPYVELFNELVLMFIKNSIIASNYTEHVHTGTHKGSLALRLNTLKTEYGLNPNTVGKRK